MKIENRFLKYISFNTQSSYDSSTQPSTSSQREFAEFLAEEMMILGLQDVYISNEGILYGTIPSNNNKVGDVIGFIAHLDTTPDFVGKDIHPQVIRDYDCSKIPLGHNKELNPEIHEELLKLKGHDLVTTDGTTLLGGDNKAGIAIIMSLVEYLHKHSECKHNDIQIAFLPDNEIHQSTTHFNIERFNADYAYTVSGGAINEINDSNFNAYKAIVEITGNHYHAEFSKHKDLNANAVATEFQNLLPIQEQPRYTEGYEGFHYLYKMKGTPTKAILEYDIKNYDFALLKDQIDHFKRAQSYLNNVYDSQVVNITFEEQYLNMKEMIDEHAYIIYQVQKSLQDIGLDPYLAPLREGVNGALLSYSGLLCPNIGSGAFYPHGPYEFVSLTMMKKGVELLLKLIKNNVRENEDVPF